MQSYSESQRKALAAFSMVKGGLGAGLDVQDLLKAVEPALADESVREFFDAFMREDRATYGAIADKDLKHWQSKRADFIALQTKVTLAASALTAARAELETLCAELPMTLQWTATGFEVREYMRQESELKAGRRTKARDEEGNFQGKDKGHIYVPFSCRLVASKATKEHNIRLIGRRVGDMAGRWSVTASIDLHNGEVLKFNVMDIDPRRAINNAYMELCQQLGQRGLLTASELSFIVNFGAVNLPGRYVSTLTNIPRDVLGVGGAKRLSDYVELEGDDRIE